MFFFWPPPGWCGRLRRGVEAATAEDEAVRAAYDLAKIIVAAETARPCCGGGRISGKWNADAGISR
jgi:hypothetical protein